MTEEEIKERERQIRIQERQRAEAENAKFFHIEMKDLTPDTNLYYSDIISNRLGNILKRIDIYSCKEISGYTRKEFMAFRSCGKTVADEVETLLHQCGLDWKVKA